MLQNMDPDQTAPKAVWSGFIVFATMISSLKTGTYVQ